LAAENPNSFLNGPVPDLFPSNISTTDILKVIMTSYVDRGSEIQSKRVLWKKKNAQVLHIIQLSSGRHILDEISHYKTAQSAWNHLSIRYGEISNDKLDELQDGTFSKM
jgi:hypothetical protein